MGPMHTMRASTRWVQGNAVQAEDGGALYILGYASVHIYNSGWHIPACAHLALRHTSCACACTQASW